MNPTQRPTPDPTQTMWRSNLVMTAGAVAVVAAIALNGWLLREAVAEPPRENAALMEFQTSTGSTGDALEQAWLQAECRCQGQEVALVDESAFVFGDTSFARLDYRCLPAPPTANVMDTVYQNAPDGVCHVAERHGGKATSRAD